MRDGQRTEAAAQQLRQLGVAKVDHDQLREIGRGVRDRGPSVDQLCGRCGDRKLAVSPAGEVWPCTMARWMPLGQVRQASLAHIYQQSAQLRRDLQRDLGILHASGSDGGCEAPVCCDPHYKQK